MICAQVIIVGCGVGGHGAALHARSQGLKTCVLSGGDVGGTCVNRGCVPSKALLAASGRVREMSDDDHLASMGISTNGVSFDREGVAKHAEQLVNKVRGGLEGSLGRLGVDLVPKFGVYKEPHVLDVGNGETMTAQDIILAPGSVPFVPPGVEVDGTESAFLEFSFVDVPTPGFGDGSKQVLAVHVPDAPMPATTDVAWGQ